MKKLIIELSDEHFDLVGQIAKSKNISSEMLAILCLTEEIQKSMRKVRTKQINDEVFHHWVESDFVSEGSQGYNKLYSFQVYGYFVKWCQRFDREPLNHKVFGTALTGLGLPKGRDSNGVFYWFSCMMLEDEMRAFKNTPATPLAVTT